MGIQKARKFFESTLRLAGFVSASALCVWSAPQSNTPAAGSPAGFDSPKLAVDALVEAAANYDVPALLHVLGPDAKDLVASNDPVQDKKRSQDFAELARKKTSIQMDSKTASRAELSVGDDDTPFPIPLTKIAGKWYFDTKAGRREILYRRIGENELDAITVCRGFVEAQKEYAMNHRTADGLAQYASRIISSPGKQDGLAWQNPDGTWEGPVGEEVAKAITDGYDPSLPAFHGYYFKILKAQGPAAPLGAMNFEIDGALIGGFALAAAPAQYRVTGVQTFIVGYDGIVYQKDLGPNTLTVFRALERYNPDKTWRRTDDAP